MIHLENSKTNPGIIGNRLVRFIFISSVFAILYNNLNKYSAKNSIEAFRPTESFDPWYYSFIVSSTIGFGDIVPLTNAARWLTVLHVCTLWISKDSYHQNTTTIVLMIVCVLLYLGTNYLTLW